MGGGGNIRVKVCEPCGQERGQGEGVWAVRGGGKIGVKVWALVVECERQVHLITGIGCTRISRAVGGCNCASAATATAATTSSLPLMPLLQLLLLPLLQLLLQLLLLPLPLPLPFWGR